MKCNCGDESTGNTTICCCNVCGLPIKTEPWNINVSLLAVRLCTKKKYAIAFQHCSVNDEGEAIRLHIIDAINFEEAVGKAVLISLDKDYRIGLLKCVEIKPT